MHQTLGLITTAHSQIAFENCSHCYFEGDATQQCCIQKLMTRKNVSRRFFFFAIFFIRFRNVISADQSENKI